MTIAVLAGDGIGPEVTEEAVAVLRALDLDGLTLVEGLVGAAATRATGAPLPPETLAIAEAADAILFGAVGDPESDALPRPLRPEAAIFGLRYGLGLFANLRPAQSLASLAQHSALRPEIAARIDLLIVRELNGDVYFGEKGQRRLEDGRREGWDMMRYAEDEVRRIAHVGFRAARDRRGRLCSVDKANVLETSELWRSVVTEVARDYPDVSLSHLYVDNAAMQLVRDPGQFDVIVTGNLFGDILSDLASACVGSIGLMASAALGKVDAGKGRAKGLYEPIHGSAPDIAGKGIANPIAAILSAAMLLRHSLGLEAPAARIEAAVAATLADGILGHDLGGTASTAAIGAAVRARLATGALA